ncbi:phosphotransferase enzyme family protein [Penicillium samsonianum]|uniref:phosphotransferase enzyme family protein n=1 Tax=Penicillium samsonianum TaxID=1882272 RepID=UPI0025498061|nr:phosphotransferase enzyme family protein [Penicillium samsonianum]KAJ6148927.1 phosphotransferase enzyme family protein [Penicillium samsonianum]
MFSATRAGDLIGSDDDLGENSTCTTQETCSPRQGTTTTYVKDGMSVKDSEFAIGPATDRDWFDADRSILDIERGPFMSGVALFCGRKLYQPDAEKKLTALSWYKKIVDITDIIDWQSCHVSPLFNHNPHPAFLDWGGLEPETLDLAPRPSLSGLPPKERSLAMGEYTVQNGFIGWRKLMHVKNPDFYREVEFRKMPADIPFPFEFSETDFERIKLNSDDAVAGTELVPEVKERMGDLWPDKGFIEHKRYDECKAALGEVKRSDTGAIG